MEKRSRKCEQNDKKSELFNDRGDVTEERKTDTQACTGERGDSVEKLPPKDKLGGAKLGDALRFERTRARLSTHSALSDKVLKRINEKMQMAVKPLDISRRRMLNAMYTFRRVSNESAPALAAKAEETPAPAESTDDSFNIEPAKQESEECTKEEHPVQSNTSTASAKLEDKQAPQSKSSQERQVKASNSSRQQKRSHMFIRKPIIRTVTSKDASRVYKAVTFIDQSRKTPLKINIPTKTYSPTKTSSPVCVRPAQSVVKEKPKSKQKIIPSKMRNGRLYSPLLSRKPKSVVTEVAKWAPSSVDDHTQPYYEAWVNTTLTAVSRHDDKELKNSLIEKVKRVFEASPMKAPTLEDLSDERFTGTIRVKQRRTHTHRVRDFA